MTPAVRSLPVWLASIPVSEWMMKPLVAVGADTTVREAAAILKVRKIRHLPVVDGGGCLVGIVTDRDLRQVVFDPRIQERVGAIAATLATLPVSEVMSRGVVTVRPTTDMRQAARLVREKKIGALPVVENERLVGIVTETDILRAFEYFLRSELTPVEPLRAAAATAERYDYGFPVSGSEDV